MKPNYKDGLFQPKLHKPEQVTATKTLELVVEATAFAPVRPEFHEAAEKARDGLLAFLKLAAHDADDYMPLLQGETEGETK